jgi:hypothetical protein
VGRELRTFEVAPMAVAFILMSGVVLAIPVIFVLIGLSDPLLRTTFVGTAAMVVVGAAGVWFFYKPTAFELEDDALVLRFPLRTIAIPRSDIASARVLSRSELRETLGFAMRVGVGGLFGVFGWLWSTKRSWVQIYVTSTGGWVLVERRAGRPLLLSAKEGAAFAAAVGGSG